jgi:hypothetical protein
MLNLRKNTLAAAVAAVTVVGGGLSFAQNVNAAVSYVAANNLGQALIYPYYTVRDNWRTFIHVTNTSASTVATKVRIRSAPDSTDILDFQLILSPHDMWTAVIEERNGAPGIRATDNSCTVPNIGIGNFIPFRSLEIDNDFGIDLLNQMREGYVEIIEMGIAKNEDQPIAVAAKHGASGVPANCGAIVTAFGSGSTGGVANIETTRNQFSNNDTAAVNVLAGKFDLVNPVAGQSGASRAVAIADFNLEAGNLIYGQFDPQWDYPRLSSTQSVAPEIGPAVPNSDIGPIVDALNTVAVSNEWVLNPNLGELSSWVITFPTNNYESVTGTDKPVSIHLWNREEKTPTVDVDFSPGGTTPPDLDFEVNVINFISPANNITSTGLLKSVVSKDINVDILASPFLGGWARIEPLTDRDFPAIGFNLTARTNPDDAVLYDHVYEGREQVPGLVPPPAQLP